MGRVDHDGGHLTSVRRMEYLNCARRGDESHLVCHLVAHTWILDRFLDISLMLDNQESTNIDNT